MAAAPNSSQFSLFTSLAPELRSQIWREALPDDVGATLYPYKPGCFGPRELEEGDPQYDDTGENLVMDWRHDFLDDVLVEIPLFFVGREARHIALRWMREQCIQIKFQHGESHPIFVRSLNLERDSLYVPLEKWDEFTMEPYNRMFGPEFEDRNFGNRNELKQLALPIDLLRETYYHYDSISESLKWFNMVQTLLVVVDVQPDWLGAIEDGNTKAQCRWEVLDAQRGAWLWNLGDQRFIFGDGERGPNEELCKLMEKLIRDGLAEAIPQLNEHFAIRPVIAVRR